MQITHDDALAARCERQLRKPAASRAVDGQDGRRFTGQLTTITSTSLAPKSNWRMRASSFCSSSGVFNSVDRTRQPTTSPPGAIFSCHFAL